MALIAMVEDRMLTDGVLADRLRQVGYQVEVFGEEAEAGSILGRRRPDLAVLVVHGLDLCRELRSQHPKLPLLLISQESEREHQFQAFEAGADDFLVLPVDLRELEYRVRALLRRSGGREPRELKVGPFELDERTGSFSVDGRRVHLTPRETELMAELMARPGQLIPRGELLEQIWQIDETKTLDVHLRSLRRKVEADPGRPRHLISVRGRGIRLDA